MILVLSMPFLGSPLIFQVNAINDVKILCLIENNFGESYYINKAILENYDYTIVTASTSFYVFGCQNKDINDTTSNILISEIQNDEISNYDCIMIPSGGHWINIVNTDRILEIIQFAHENDILVAGICTGMIVLAFAEILEGINVAQNDFATFWLVLAGANITTESVVCDQGIITGGWGGGLGSGAEEAPNEEFCAKIKEEIDAKIISNVDFPFFIGIFALIGLSFLIVIIRKPKK